MILYWSQGGVARMIKNIKLPARNGISIYFLYVLERKKNSWNIWKFARLSESSVCALVIQWSIHWSSPIFMLAWKKCPLKRSGNSKNIPKIETDKRERIFFIALSISLFSKSKSIFLVRVFSPFLWGKSILTFFLEFFPMIQNQIYLTRKTEAKII